MKQEKTDHTAYGRAITAGVLAMSLLLVSCAAIIHGTKQKIEFSSAPSGATVTVDGESHGATPTVVNLKRRKDHSVRITLDGYEPYDTTVEREISGWLFGNILIGGLIGIAIDATTGSMYRLDPKEVDAQLTQGNISQKSQKDGLYIFVVLQPDSEWKKIGQLTPTAVAN